MGWRHIREGPEIIIWQINQFSEKLTKKMFIEASRKSSLQIARLYLIDSSSFKNFTGSSFLYGLTKRWWILDRKQKHLITQLFLNNVIFKKKYWFIYQVALYFIIFFNLFLIDIYLM